MFCYNWGKRDWFLVKEEDNDVEWEEVWERVRDTFLMARNRVGMRASLGASGGAGGVREKKWQVWVSGPEEEGEEEEL